MNRCPLIVAEPLNSYVPCEVACRYLLRVHVKKLTISHNLKVYVNGKPAGEAKMPADLNENPEDVWMEFIPDVKVFCEGENLITAVVDTPNTNDGYPEVDNIRLDVWHDA